MCSCSFIQQNGLDLVGSSAWVQQGIIPATTMKQKSRRRSMCTPPAAAAKGEQFRGGNMQFNLKDLPPPHKISVNES